MQDIALDVPSTGSEISTFLKRAKSGRLLHVETVRYPNFQIDHRFWYGVISVFQRLASVHN